MTVHPAVVLARAAAGVQAFVAGRRIGQEWSEGELMELEVRRVLDRESVPALAVGAAALGTAAFAFARRPELVALAAAGALVGSGLVGRGVRWAGALRSRGRPPVVRVSPAPAHP